MKRFFRNEKIPVLALVLVLLSAAGVYAKFEIEDLKRNSGIRVPLAESINLPKKVIDTPTPAPPTVTPTLTPQQLAEIKKKKFEDYNQKYGPCRWIPVLMYHHVMPDDQAKAILAAKLNVPPDVFRQQMDFLIGKGYQVIGLDEMMIGLKNGTLPAKPVVLTFDDAYRDFYDFVFPILKEKNLKATVFVITQYVGGERYVTWDQLGRLSSNNLILVGNHTLNHPNLLKLSDEELKNQIISANNILDQRLGRQVKYFAYPYGNAGQTRSVLGEAGFGGAVLTTNSNPQCVGLPYDLSRIRIGAASLSRFGL